MRLNVIFGSTSDEDKVLPGIERATEDIEGLEVRVHYASADNTPEKVDRIVSRIVMNEHGGTPFISGAGMSNVLTGVVKTYATLNDLVIGIPISDSTTDGLSSFLSTSEKPPLNPVLTVGLNNSYAAIQIAHRFMNGDFMRVVINDDYNEDNIGDDEIDKIHTGFGRDLGMTYQFASPGGFTANDLVLTPFYEADDLLPTDKILREGKGIQIGVNVKGSYDSFEYEGVLNGLEVTGLVTAGNYANAIQMAAQITQHQGALAVIQAKKVEKTKDLSEHPGLLVANGKSERYKGG